MRCALLGSPGIGVPYRLPFRVTGSQATLLGAGATYLAVVAGHQLDLQFNGIGPVTVTFTGAEVGQAAFHAAINAVLNLFGMPTGATAVAGVANSGGQSLFSAPFLGSFSGGEVLPTTDADVLASLGIAVAPFVSAVPGLTVYCGRYARQVGGPRDVLAAGVNQHFIFLGNRYGNGVMVLDRNAPAAPAAQPSSDDVRYNPSGLP